MKPEREKPQMEHAGVPKKLMDAINKAGLLFDEGTEPVVQEVVKMLEGAKTLEEFRGTLNLVERAITDDLSRRPMLGEYSAEDAIAPVLRGLLLKMAKKYLFNKVEE